MTGFVETMVKKLIAFLMAVTGIFFSGCTKKIEISPAEKTPSEFVEQIYEGLSDKSLTFYKVYLNYLSDSSKAAFEALEYTERESERFAVLYEKEVTVESIESVEEAEFDGGITRVQTSLQYTAKGQSAVFLCEDYVEKSEKGYRLLYNGILSQKSYAMNTAEDSNKIHISSLTLYTCVDGMRVEMDVHNDSLSRFSIGADTGAGLTLLTDSGEYSYTLPQVYKLGANKQLSLTAFYSKAQGTVQKLTLLNIYTLDVLGNRIETDEGKSYSVVLQ